MARRLPRGFVRPPARTKIWIGAGVGEQTAATAVQTLIGTYSAGVLGLRPFTILRTRILFTVISDQSGADEGVSGAYAEIVVKETATTVGITALPGPLTEVDADFYLYQGFTARFEFSSAAGFESNGGAQYLIDSKAMRKVGHQDDLAAQVELRGQGGAIVQSEGRQLIMLH